MATITDDNEGRLFIDGQIVGDIIYTHGLAIITSGSIANELDSSYTSISSSFSWKSNQPIYIGSYHCKVKDYEFNYSQNPSAQVSGSDAVLADFATGSYFRPYITSVGLYNDASELIAVAKLGTPIPKSPDTDMTFVIKLDY